MISRATLPVNLSVFFFLINGVPSFLFDDLLWVARYNVYEPEDQVCKVYVRYHSTEGYSAMCSINSTTPSFDTN